MNETIESQKEEICRAHQGDEQLRRDHQILREQLLQQNWDLREARVKSERNGRIEAISRVKIDESSRTRLIENQDTILELTARIHELQNEVNCLNDSRDLKDVESVRSGLSHVPSQPALLRPFRDPGGISSRSLGMPSCNDGPPSIWDAHVVSETFLQIQMRHLQHVIRRN